MSMKVLQKVPDVHKMLIDFRKKEDKIVFGRLLGPFVRVDYGDAELLLCRREEKRCTSLVRNWQQGFAV